MSLANVSLQLCDNDTAPPCTSAHFRCKTGVCLSRDHVCDLHPDCLYGEDEANCDDIPAYGLCDFENSTCGWHNTDTDDIDWTSHQGHTQSSGTGPTSDHTVRGDTDTAIECLVIICAHLREIRKSVLCNSGTYMYVEASQRLFKHAAHLESPVFPALTTADPGPCNVRFFYHMFGRDTGYMAVTLRSVCNDTADPIELWVMKGDQGNWWHRASATIPTLGVPYVLTFKGVIGIRFRGDIAIDDVSLSRECFTGTRVPPNGTSSGGGSYIHEEYVNQSRLTCVTHKPTYSESDRDPSPTLSTGYPNSLVYLTVVVTSLSILVTPCLLALVCLVRRRRRLKKMRGATLPSPFELLGRTIHRNDTDHPSSLVHSDLMVANPLYGVKCDLDQLVHLDRDHIALSRIIGSGAFGEVYLGYLSYLSAPPGNDPPTDTGHPTHVTQQHIRVDPTKIMSNQMTTMDQLDSSTHVLTKVAVAVKTLPEMSSPERENEFAMEASIMSKFSHPNIVRFFGVCFDRHPRMIVLELLWGGDLQSFLKSSRPIRGEDPDLRVMDLLHLALDIALGCHYLEQSRFIHRDIAARNCLLTSKRMPDGKAKIADFGLSKDIYKSDYYRKNGAAMLPIKWMPPEAFLDGTFTSKTDVWAYGVLLWEIMSMGQVPYPGLSNGEVIERVTEGHRMDAPMNCAPSVYDMMLTCWRTNPESRPNFTEIINYLEECLLDRDVITSELPIYLHDQRMSYSSPENSFDSRTPLIPRSQCTDNAYLEPVVNVSTTTSYKLKNCAGASDTSVSAKPPTISSEAVFATSSSDKIIQPKRYEAYDTGTAFQAASRNNPYCSGRGSLHNDVTAHVASDNAYDVLSRHDKHGSTTVEMIQLDQLR